MRLVTGGMFLVVFASTSANAASLTAVTRGSYSDIGRHFPENLNYIAGNSTNVAELRDFFVFDLSTVNAPIGSATLHLWNPADPFGYRSEDGSETYTVFDVATPIADFMQEAGPETVDGIPAFVDLGSGTSFGFVTVTELSDETFIDIELNAAAISYLNLHLGESVAFGGAITSLDGDFGTVEYLFAGTNDGLLTDTQLNIQTVPLPSSALLLASGLYGLVGWAKRKAIVCNYS